MTNRHARPEPPDTIHFDVAAYALGVLDPADIQRCELHLAECPSCAAELEALLPVSTLLADVDPNALRELDDPAMLERLTCAVRADRHRVRRRQRLTAAAASAAAAAVAGFALFAGASWFDLSPGAPLAGESPAPASPSVEPTGPGTGGPELAEGEEFSVTDPATGVHADVVLTARDWGTQVSFSLSSVAGPLECQLLLVYADGSAEVAGSWRVPDEGYGTPQQPDPLLLEAAVSADRADLAELRINALGPDGGTDPLVSVPL